MLARGKNLHAGPEDAISACRLEDTGNLKRLLNLLSDALSFLLSVAYEPSRSAKWL